MYAIVSRILLTTGSLTLLIGCSTNQNVRDLSSETLIQVLEYQSTMQDINRNLQSNYDNRLKRLSDSAENQESVGRTVLYTTLADVQTEKIRHHGFLSSDLRFYLTEATGGRRAIEESYEKALMSLEAKHQAIVADIAFKESQLRPLRNKLEQLQSNESSMERIRQIIPLLRATRETYENIDMAN